MQKSSISTIVLFLACTQSRKHLCFRFASALGADYSTVLDSTVAYSTYSRGRGTGTSRYGARYRGTGPSGKTVEHLTEYGIPDSKTFLTPINLQSTLFYSLQLSFTLFKSLYLFVIKI